MNIETQTSGEGSKHRYRRSVWLFLAIPSILASALFLLACDVQPPAAGKLPEQRMPLEKLVGEKITFDLCGQRMSIRRSAVRGLQTNGAEGLVMGRVRNASIFLNPDDIKDWAGMPAHGSVSIGCRGKPAAHEFIYRHLYGKAVTRTDLPETGLERLEDQVRGRSPVFAAFYQPLSRATENGNFEMRCHAGSAKEVPFRCAITGISRYTLQMYMSISSPGVFEHWVEFKKYYENFVTIEEVQ